MRRVERRRRAERWGRRAEWLCVWSLRLRGYRILARRFRVPVGEIDIIARRGGTLAIIEVKARPSQYLAFDAVPNRSRRRLRHAASIFVQRRPSLQGLAVRFDLMVVTPLAWPRHVAGAWMEDTDDG
jgi:putative endonuclease